MGTLRPTFWTISPSTFDSSANIDAGDWASQRRHKAVVDVRMVLARPGGGQLRLNGLIDFGNASTGDRLFDLAEMAR